MYTISTVFERPNLSLKRKAAPGVDDITWQKNGERLEENLRDSLCVFSGVLPGPPRPKA